jgi:hypothetical protein
MAILSKRARPEFGVDSHYEIDRALLAGFVTPGEDLPLGQRKIAAGRMRARFAAVDYWKTDGKLPSHKHLAERLGTSERCLSYQFPKQNEIYAFPPPELARSFAGASRSSRAWPDIANLIRPVFDDLETNTLGRTFMAGLVDMHRGEPQLAESDAYFATAMRSAIRYRRPRRTLPIANLFTDGVRLAFEDWVATGTPHLSFVADRLASLLIGPVQNAYDALLIEQRS